MAADVFGFIDALFGAIGQLTGFIRGAINGIASQYLSIILLVLAGIGGYYLHKKFPTIRGYGVAVVYGFILYLLFRYV